MYACVFGTQWKIQYNKGDGSDIIVGTKFLIKFVST